MILTGARPGSIEGDPLGLPSLTLRGGLPFENASVIRGLDPAHLLFDTRWPVKASQGPAMTKSSVRLIALRVKEWWEAGPPGLPTRRVVQVPTDSLIFA